MAASKQDSGLFVESDISRGMRRDAPRVAIPDGGVYDSADYLLHQPGVAIKRGGTSYAGPALTGATYARAVAYADYSAGAQLLAIGDNNHLFKVTSGTTTDVVDLGAGGWGSRDQPKLVRTDKVVICASNGTTAPKKFDGTTVANLGGTPPAGQFSTLYKTRLVLAATAANPNRVYFSPTPDIESTWDTTNSWIDCDYQISGMAALSNAIILFSNGHTERIIGTTPPPGSDMDRAPIGSIGCTDARSIVVQENNVLFANPRGVYLTNGSGFASLTTEGGIETYWQSLFTGYDPLTWQLSAGILRSYYFVTLLNSSGTLVASLMCNVPRRAWWRLTNQSALMYAQAVGVQDELYYADRSTNRVVALSGIFTASSSNKNDANGTAVTPLLEYRALTRGTGLTSWGDGRLSFYMADAASDNPTMGITVKTGVRAATSSTPSESPLAENTDEDRKRFTVAKDAQAVTIKLQQSNASSATEVYALEVEGRPHSPVEDGVG